MFLAFLLLADDPHRAALAHYGAGRLLAATDRPASAARELIAANRADPPAAEPKRELVAVYARLGRDAAAIRVANEVLAADPTDHLTARRLGRLLWDGKLVRQAADAFRQAADSPTLPPADRPFLLREAAKASAAAGDPGKAADALKLIPTPDGDTLEELAVALTGSRQFAAAEAAYREAARRFAADGDAARAARLGWHRGKVLAAAGKFPDAVAAIEPFLALRPTTLPPYTDYADWLRGAGRQAEASDKLGKLADAFPGEPRIRWVQAAELTRRDPAGGLTMLQLQFQKSADPALAGLAVRALTAAGRGDLLATLLTRPKPEKDDDDSPPDPAAADRVRAVAAAVRDDPAATPLLLEAARTARGWPAEVWGQVGFLAERAGRQADAETALRNGLPADPDLFRPLYQLLYRQRRWRDIVSLCQQMDALPPAAGGQRRVPLIGAYLAPALAELGEGRRAIEAIDAAANSAASRAAVRVQKVHILLILNRTKPALDECDAIVAEFPDPGTLRDVRLNRSTAYQQRREFAAAERELRLILEDDPDDVQALNNLGYHLADEGRNLAEAEALVRRAVELDTAERRKRGDPAAESGTYLDSLGWVLFKRGDLAGARAALETASKLPDGFPDPTVWDHLGDVRFRQGDADGARAAWQTADAGYADSHTGRQFGRQAEVRRKLGLVR